MCDILSFWVINTITIPQVRPKGPVVWLASWFLGADVLSYAVMKINILT